MRLLRTVPNRLLTVTAILGGLALVVVAAGFLVGVRPVFLKSGSMAPTMPTGTLALVKQVPAAQLAVGDVVCVETPSGSRVTHRIEAIARSDGTAYLTLRGDANEAPDPHTYPVVAADRVIADVPGVGYLFGWFGTPIGLVVSGALVVALLILLVRGDPRPPGDSGRTGGRHRSRRAVVGAATALMILGPGQVAPAAATPWTDPVTVSGTALTAAVVPPSASFTCGALGLFSVRFDWTAVAGATNYTLHYGSGGTSTATVTGTSALLTSAISGGTAWVVANRNFGSTTWSSVASTTRSYTVAVVSLCF